MGLHQLASVDVTNIQDCRKHSFILPELQYPLQSAVQAPSEMKLREEESGGGNMTGQSWTVDIARIAGNMSSP